MSNKKNSNRRAIPREDLQFDPDALEDEAPERQGQAEEPINDAWITTHVKMQFVDEDALLDSHLIVDTRDHVVTLSGRVASDTGRSRAVSIARSTQGVARVVDELAVVPVRW